MNSIWAILSEETREGKHHKSYWAYEVIAAQNAKDMVRKLSARKPARIFIDPEMVAKLSKEDLAAVVKDSSVTVLPKQVLVRYKTRGTKARSQKRIDPGKEEVSKYIQQLRTAGTKRLNRILVNTLKTNEMNREAESSNPVKTPRVILPELHDAATGRIDAKKVAAYLAIPLSKISESLKVDYKTIYKTPSAAALQPRIRPIKRSLEILSEMIDNRKTVLAWLNTPHPFLDKKTPLQIIEEGDAEQLETILENVVAGIPY
jgi:hypothetical protein